MYTLFVLGNIASGKSLACKFLQQLGARVIDLDQLAKSLYYPGSAVVEDLVDVFGWQILDSCGGINSSVLAQLAFSSHESCLKLNQIVHPYVINKLADLLVPPFDCSLNDNFVFTVVEISVPDVLKTISNLADCVMVIDAPYETRCLRARNRGMSLEDFNQRCTFQPSDEYLCSLADVVIDNGSNIDQVQLKQQIFNWFSQQTF